MGLEVKGKIRIFKNTINEKDLYSTTISKKDVEGKWEKMFISIQLPKDTVIEDKTDIEVVKGFLSFYKDKNNMPKIKIVIQDYNLLENPKQNTTVLNDTQSDIQNDTQKDIQELNIQDDDLPF